MPALNGSASGRARTTSSSPRTAARSIEEGRLRGGFGGPAGRRLRLERPVGPSLRAGFEQNVDVVDHDVPDPQGTRPQRNGIDGDPDPARPNHERLGPPGSVGERNVGGLERRGEGERQAEGAGDLHLAPDGLAGDSLNGPAQPSGHDRSRRRTRGDHPGGEGDHDEETPPPRGHAPRCSVPSCHRGRRVRPWLPSGSRCRPYVGRRDGAPRTTPMLVLAAAWARRRSTCRCPAGWSSPPSRGRG